MERQVSQQYQSIIIKMTIIQIFRKDRKFWSEAEIEQVQLFFMLHPFFSKFYQHQDFEKVNNLTFFTRLEQNQQICLQVNKKSQIVILLSGEITVYRKMQEGEGKKKSKKKDNQVIHDQYVKMGQYRDSYQVIEVRNDVIVKAKPQQTSQFLFVPTMLYQSHCYIVNKRKLEKVLQVLERMFSEVSRRDLKILAQSGCIFKELKMNGFIYRAGSVPEYCYILVSGNAKIQSTGFSAKKMMDMSIIGQNTLFGDHDLNDQSRLHNALCCSSHCKVLAIKKEPYNKFIAKNKHINPAYAEKLKSYMSEISSRSRVEKQEEHILPRISRFHSYARVEDEQKIENDILQNCHILINLNHKKRSKTSFRLPEHTEKDYSVNQFQRKVSLFKRRKPTQPFDLSNKLF